MAAVARPHRWRNPPNEDKHRHKIHCDKKLEAHWSRSGPCHHAKIGNGRGHWQRLCIFGRQEASRRIHCWSDATTTKLMTSLPPLQNFLIFKELGTRRHDHLRCDSPMYLLRARSR
jgi:hypothetical protein